MNLSPDARINGMAVYGAEHAKSCLGSLWERPGEAILVIRDDMTIRAAGELAARVLERPPSALRLRAAAS